MKITSKSPFEPVLLTLILETPEELRLLGDLASFQNTIPNMMHLKGEEFNTVRTMLSKIFTEICVLRENS